MIEQTKFRPIYLVLNGAKLLVGLTIFAIHLSISNASPCAEIVASPKKTFLFSRPYRDGVYVRNLEVIVTAADINLARAIGLQKSEKMIGYIHGAMGGDLIDHTIEIERTEVRSYKVRKYFSDGAIETHLDVEVQATSRDSAIVLGSAEANSLVNSKYNKGNPRPAEIMP